MLNIGCRPTDRPKIMKSRPSPSTIRSLFGRCAIIAFAGGLCAGAPCAAAAIVSDGPTLPDSQTQASTRSGLATPTGSVAVVTQDTARGASPDLQSRASPSRAIATPLPLAGTPRQIADEGGAEGPAVPTSSTPGDDPDAHPEQLLALFPDATARPTKNMDELDLVLGQRQIFTDLRTLQDRINDTQRPTTNAVVRYSSQSDHLDIRQAEVSQDLFFSQGLSQLRLGVQAINYNPRLGPDVTQYAAGVTGNHRISDLAALNGEFWVNQLRSGGAHDDKVTYDAFLTLRPSDTIRIDIDTSRRLFDNIKSLLMGLTATSYGGSIDFTPMDDLRLTARGAYGSYSDGNRRRSEELEGVWRVTSRPIIEIGLRGTSFHFSRLLDDGYFNPRNYYSGEAMFRLKTDVTPKLTVELAGSGGLETADPGGTKPLVKGSLQVAYKVLARWSLDGELSHFSSRQSTSSGFSRTTALLGLHHRF